MRSAITPSATELAASSGESGGPKASCTRRSCAIARDQCAGAVAVFWMNAANGPVRGVTTDLPDQTTTFTLTVIQQAAGTYSLDTQPVGYRQKVDLSSLTPATMTAPDTLTATLNVNVVLRWEYRLGSTAFLVYTRAQTPALVPVPVRRIRAGAQGCSPSPESITPATNARMSPAILYPLCVTM